MMITGTKITTTTISMASENNGKKSFDCLLCILVCVLPLSLSSFVGYCNFYNIFDYLSCHKHINTKNLSEKGMKKFCIYKVNKVLPSNFFYLF